MNEDAARAIQKGTPLMHTRFGRVTARGPIHLSTVWGAMVWIDTPECPIAPDRPYNAHISQLEFAEMETTRRGGTVRTPPGSKYSWQSWTKGYLAWLSSFPLYLFLWGFAKLFKRVPDWLLRKLLRSWHRTTESRELDVRIPSSGPVYMKRWWRIKRNAFFNIYYHHVLRSDEDRALHDHPWWNFSIVLEGGYYEHCIADGGVHTKTWYPAGSVRFRRSGTFAHRLELEVAEIDDELNVTRELPVKTIFITGPVLRRWGFHHPKQWVDAYEWDAFCRQEGIESEMQMSGYSEQLTKNQ
jgi:hypothetical protein